MRHPAACSSQTGITKRTEWAASCHRPEGGSPGRSSAAGRGCEPATDFVTTLPRAESSRGHIGTCASRSMHGRKAIDESRPVTSPRGLARSLAWRRGQPARVCHRPPWSIPSSPWLRVARQRGQGFPGRPLPPPTSAPRYSYAHHNSTPSTPVRRSPDKAAREGEGGVRADASPHQMLPIQVPSRLFVKATHNTTTAHSPHTAPTRTWHLPPYQPYLATRLRELFLGRRLHGPSSLCSHTSLTLPLNAHVSSLRPGRPPMRAKFSLKSCRDSPGRVAFLNATWEELRWKPC